MGCAVKVFIIAGEPSGDILGASLMQGLRQITPEVSFDGIGGPQMEGCGLRSLFAMQELSLMGIAEILPKYFHLKRRIRETAEAVIAARPDVLITIDSPDFCLRVARLVKAGAPIRTVHYVAPTVWAWRAGRAEKMAQVIDHVLALFPFEPPLMQAAGMACDFVGHPVAAEPPVSDAVRSAFEGALGPINGQVLTILPGSRRSELQRLGPIFEAAFDQVSDRFETVIIPTLPHLVPEVDRMLPLRSARSRVVVDGTGETAQNAARLRLVAMARADVALAASGTVSLELAAAGTPMVIAYDMNWFSRQIIARMLLTDTVTLVNLVSDTRSVPECLGANCTPDNIAKALGAVASDPAAQHAALSTTMDRLGRGGDAPGLRAAQAIMARLP